MFEQALPWCLLWYVLSHFPSAVHGLERRDAPLVPLTIPLSLDANMRYTAEVNMSSGTNPQKFKFALSTSIGYSTVAGNDCQTCAGVPTYDSGASSSAHIIDAPEGQNITFLDGSAQGQAFKEDCSLHVADGSAWNYPNQTIIVSQVSSDIYSDGVSGLFGLGINRQQDDFNATVISGWLLQNPTQSNFSYGMQLNNPRGSSEDAGVLHWISPISSAYEGDVAWFNASTTSSGMDWNVPMTGWSSTSGTFNPSRSGADLRASIDPYYPNIYMPQQDSRLLFAAVPGATPKPTTSFSTQYSVPCSTTMTFTVSFGDISFTMDQSTLVIHKSETECVSAIEAWTAADTTDFLLGSTFISSVYLIFQVSRDSQGTIGFAHRAKGVIARPLSKGAIAGISVAAVLVVFGIAIGIFLFYRRRQLRNAPSGTVKEKNSDVEPFDLSVNGRQGQGAVPPNITTLQPARRILIEESPGVYVEANSDYRVPVRQASKESAASSTQFQPITPLRHPAYNTIYPDTPVTSAHGHGNYGHSRGASVASHPTSPTPLLYNQNSPPKYEA